MRYYSNILLVIIFLCALLLSFAGSCVPGDDDDSSSDTGSSGDDDDNDDNDNDDSTTAQTTPNSHKELWNCYLCHEEGLYATKPEPHDHVYTAPVDCLICHQIGTWSFTDPNAAGAHGSSQDCLNCHQSTHEVTWTDSDQCLVCHLPGQIERTYPKGHVETWDCYICHEEDFYGALGEPHDSKYNAPVDCLACHEQGEWSYLNPSSPQGHGSKENCLDCHQGNHNRTWTGKNQCLMCHLPGPDSPEYSTQHDDTWTCTICHGVPDSGAPLEPHGGQYTAPTQCTQCHKPGDFENPPAAKPPREDHDPSFMCLDCHSGRHGQPWEDRYQCMICHQFE